MKKHSEINSLAGSSLIRYTVGVMLVFWVSLYAQKYPDTLKIPVTFYDFHADGSNPEFEPEHNGGLHKGMIEDTLDANRKPVVGKKPFFNHYIHKWFVPWTPGDFTIPVYTNREGKFGGIDTVDYDTAFKNIVLNDHLPFIHLGDGLYRFERSGSNQTSEFFWLDGKGFGNEPKGKNHNYSFTLELHTTFTYQKGLRFDFLGDDDVWAFINGKLAMDLGGIHSSEAGSINLDNIAAEFGLIEGNVYPFDFFYAERHTNNSTIKITTNLFTPQAVVALYRKDTAPNVGDNNPIKDNDTIIAGELFNIYAHVVDTSWQPEWDKLVGIEVLDPENRVEVRANANGSVQLFPDKAYGYITVVSKFVNPDDPSSDTIKASVRLYVAPGKPHHLNIQQNPTITNYNDDDHTPSIDIETGVVSVSLYAVVRDSLGNFIRMADLATWQSSAPLVALVKSGSTNYEGIITVVRGGLTQVKASEPGLIPASVDVRVKMPDAVILKAAVTRDDNGDGFLDGIDISFESAVSIPNSKISNVKVVFQGITFVVDSISMGSDSTRYRIWLQPNKSTDFQTDWKPLLSFGGLDGIADIVNFECSDGAGPVAVRALYYPGELRSKNNPNGTPDTLLISVSESVQWPAGNVDPDLVFHYFQTTFLNQDAFSTMVVVNDTLVRVVVNEVMVVRTKLDSIQLVSSGCKDLSLNQPHINSRKAAIEWGAIKFQYVPSNTPFNPGRTEIDNRVGYYYSNVIQKQIQAIPGSDPTRGVVVGVEVKGKPLKSITGSDSLFGKVVVYDPVGNAIAELGVFKAQGNDYGIYWDGRNKNGRFVGTGIYLFHISTTDVENKTHFDKLKVAVKR